MINLHALNPYSPHFEVIPDNYPSWKEFKKLSIAHQVITILATAIVTALSLTYFTASCFQTLVGRFRKIEMLNDKNPPNRPLKEVDKEVTIEDRFWEALFTDKSLHRAFEMVMKIKDIHYVERATLIANSYHEHEKNASNKFDEEQKTFLINLIANQLRKSLALFKAGGPRSIRLSNGSTLKIYDTADDGSCGFHAILGADEKGIYKCQDVLTKRRKFCDWLREEQRLQRISDEIKIIIGDYAIHYDRAPGYFREKVQARYEAYANGLDQLTNAQRDARLEEFINDALVIEAYISNMALQGTYLLQDELFIVGNFYGKRVVLFQPDWSPNGEFPMCSDPSFDREGFALGENDICVWYDGNHYERAQL